jgi:flavin reductase (DIM6/NTAB) family NADH-FMN oxidoreductase RutF
MPAKALDTREFRNALGCFATGVTVVTALDDKGEAVGITVNSFSAVSLEPPLVLWSLARSADRFANFESAKAFTVSVLGAEGAAISSRFAMKGEARVDLTQTVPTELGPPTFSQALAVFECETHARYDGGDHVIIVGRVRGFTYARDAGEMEPLLFFRGRYGVLAGLKP